MNWDAIGAVGEVTAAIGVIVSLVYLALQIRNNTHAQKTQSRLEATKAFTQFFSMMISNPDLIAIWTKALIDYDSLQNRDRTTFIWILSTLAYKYEEVFIQHQAGTIPESLWVPHRSAMRSLLEIEHIRVWWDSRATAFSDEFRMEVESAHIDSGDWDARDLSLVVRRFSDDV